jgi:hypothetical protein
LFYQDLLGTNKDIGKTSPTKWEGVFFPQGGLAFDEELHHGDLLVLLPAGLLFFLKRAACFIKKGCT